MNGAHDLGGMHGFGPVVLEPGEPVFHAEWERRAFALTVAMGGWRRWNLDMSRHAREQMPPAEYLATTYYEHWLWGLEWLLERHGFLAGADLARRVREGDGPGTRRPAEPQPGAIRPDDVPRLLQNRRAARLDDPVPPQFKAGDTVVARNVNPVGHTRIPRYVRGRRGVVDRDHGVFIFPDTHAAGLGRKPQHVYSVRFAARELWGPDAPRAATPSTSTSGTTTSTLSDPPACPVGSAATSGGRKAHGQRSALRRRRALAGAVAAAFALGPRAAPAEEIKVETLTPRPGVSLQCSSCGRTTRPRASCSSRAGTASSVASSRTATRSSGKLPGAVAIRVPEPGSTVAVMDAPSDRQDGRGLIGFRQSPAHMQDIAAVMRYLRQQAPVPVWLVGTSLGTASVAAAAIRIKEERRTGSS